MAVDEKLKVACCARCTRPMLGERFPIARFVYGECCILQVEEERKKRGL